MQRSQPPQPIHYRVVLVGAGNAHLLFVRQWAMRPIPGVSITLVNDAATVPYSAMVPGLIAGEYQAEQVFIDLVRFCPPTGVRLITETVVRIDTAQRKIHFAQRPPIGYEILSLGLGSIPHPPPGAEDLRWSLKLRPLGELIRQLELLENDLEQCPRAFHVGVVGGGASGCELALAVRRRFSRLTDVTVSLIHSGDRLLPTYPPRASRIMTEELQRQQIAIRLNIRVKTASRSGINLDSGETIAMDGVVWAVDPAPPGVLRQSGLSLDPAGFLNVHKTLQSISDPSIFGTGDCVAFPAYPELPRNGVTAVRQGQLLFRNVLNTIQNRRLRYFRPQRLWLSLLNLGYGRALASYGPLALAGRHARGWKERIDARWMQQFLASRITPGDASGPPMRCGGCGSKVPGDILAEVIDKLDVVSDTRVLLGTKSREDAAVFRGSEEGQVEVQSVDYFNSFGDDPFLLGRVAAIHAVNDLYAMNATPFAALAIATIPHARGRIQSDILAELLAGAAVSLRQMNVVLAGGHTTEAPGMGLGFSVTGYGHAQGLFRKDALKPGDVLILTKPLGIGALLAAWMRGLCQAIWYSALVESMLASNCLAAKELARRDVKCCTDVTGFGLAGHLLELLDASHLSAHLQPHQIPVLEGFQEVVGLGVVSTLHEANARNMCRIVGKQPPPALFDPQTSGGLLAGVNAEVAPDVLKALHELGMRQASIIGRAIERSDGRSQIYLDS